MQLTCTICGASHEYRAVVEFPVQCLSCQRGFTPAAGYDAAIASYEMWRNSKPKEPGNGPLILPSRTDTRRRCPSGYLWYLPEGEPSNCNTEGCPAPGHGAPTQSQRPSRAQTEPGIRTPRARTIRPRVPGATRERVQYLQLDEMEIAAIERIHAMVEQNRDYPDRSRDILLIGIAERLERIENLLATLIPKKDEE